MSEAIDTATLAVKRAAKIMDRAKPDWYRRIVFKRLDISDGGNCIAAQAGLDWEAMHEKFNRANPTSQKAPFADDNLRDLWIAEVQARRK
jgi:hypothetical protein